MLSTATRLLPFPSLSSSTRASVCFSRLFRRSTLHSIQHAPTRTVPTASPTTVPLRLVHQPAGASTRQEMSGLHSEQPNGSLSTTYDVIISGAGPVGLFLACELRLRKCSVLVLEKAEEVSSPLKRLPFGMRGLNALSIETFYRRGLLGDIPPLDWSRVHIGGNGNKPKAPESKYSAESAPTGKTTAAAGPAPAGPPRGRAQGAGFFGGISSTLTIDTSKLKWRLPSSTDLALMFELEKLETALHRRAAALGVVVKHGAAVTDFQQTEDGVSVDAGGHSYHGKWLVGCDGARSAVRKVGGFEYAGTEPEFTGYSTHVEIDDPQKQLKPGRQLTETGLYWQPFPGYMIIQEFDGGAGHKPKATVTREHVQEVLRRVSDTTVNVSTLHRASTWTDRSRQATTYRKGRVFLAGDAAHIHSPLGGQGMNLGLGDVMNLGWKLAATIHNTAPDGLLDSYYTERYPLGVKVLEWSRAQVSIMRPEPAARALGNVIRDFINTRDGATYLTERLTGITTHYELSGEHEMVGYSVPNFEMEDGTKVGELLHEGHGMLLDFDSTNGADASTLLKTIAEEYGEQMKYVSGRAKDQLGLSAVLIRPDGIVAWATNSKADEQSIREAAAPWWRRSSEASLAHAQ